MEDQSVQFDSNPTYYIGGDNMSGSSSTTATDHGWQKVTYAKRQRKTQPKRPTGNSIPDRSSISVGDSVFTSLEKQSEERRRRIEEAQRSAALADDMDAALARSRKKRNDYDDDDDEEEGSDGEIVGGENGKVEENKKAVKPKKPKKPKVTVSDAASKIDSADLAAFLLEISGLYESQEEIQLTRFADYFGRVFSAVSASQFPWLKLFRESNVAKIADIPVSHISEAVYKTSVDWINQRSYDALGSFVLWLLDSILADLASQQPGPKSSKKGMQQTSSKSQVAIFSVLAMVLRRKPDVLVNVFPKFKENSKYQGQDKLQVIVWMIAQASQGDLAVGLYLWAHHILPIVGGKLGSNPQSRDLVLQLVERILSAPKAHTILVNSPVRKGDRLMPPLALDLLLRVTFPASSARVKATERFEVIYPTLKEVSLVGSPGSKAMKQVSQQILTFAVKAAGEGIPELSREATSIFIWCLTQNPDCYKQWDKIYMDNLEASTAFLRKLNEEWKELSVKQSSLEVLGETLKSFRHKNEKALAGGEDSARQALLKEADKHCKVILGRLSRGHGCMKSVAVIIALAVGAAAISPIVESWDWNKFSVLFNAQ